MLVNRIFAVGPKESSTNRPVRREVRSIITWTIRSVLPSRRGPEPQAPKERNIAAESSEGVRVVVVSEHTSDNFAGSEDSAEVGLEISIVCPSYLARAFGVHELPTHAHVGAYKCRKETGSWHIPCLSMGQEWEVTGMAGGPPGGEGGGREKDKSL
jgi:hypothetical protein